MTNPRMKVRRGIISLTAANLTTLLVVSTAYFAYSRLLSPDQFGLYAIALIVASFATAILDSGIKSVLIKSKSELSNDTLGALLAILIAYSTILVVLTVSVGGIVIFAFSDLGKDYLFIASFATTYLLSYPFTCIPTVLLERELDYPAIAWIESLAIVLERGSPVLFLILLDAGINSFLWGAMLGRAFRIISLSYLHKPILRIPSRSETVSILQTLSEGLWLQSAIILSLCRDNIHGLLVGPLFGRHWVGYYAWGLQLAALVSQVFAQIAARISLPLFSQMNDEVERWQRCLLQIKLLTILTAPLLFAMLVAIRDINDHFFLGKWSPALGLLPFLFLRMLPGLSTTSLGALLLVEKGGARFALANLFWTLAEIVGAGIFLLALGANGLAWSYSIVVWGGLALFLACRNAEWWGNYIVVLKLILLRPSVATSFLLAGSYMLYSYKYGFGAGQNLPISLAAGCFLVGLAYLSEREFYEILKGHDGSAV